MVRTGSDSVSVRKMRKHGSIRWVAWATAFVTTAVQLIPANAYAPPRPPIKRSWGVRPGFTQVAPHLTPRPPSRDGKGEADVRELSAQEMKAIRGRSPYRNPYFDGVLPWQRQLRDVNLSNGNLFKSFTDIQVAPAKGAGLALQRTYNSNDSRIGPFGVGWTHAYDIRCEEAGSDNSPRTDFFGGKHTYHRDADGLYTPPTYLFDERSSEYNTFLVNGPTNILTDTEKGMDGTVKHFFNNGTERACDTITDRHGNGTTLAYNLTVTLGDGSQKKLLTSVTDPSGRQLVFTWQNLGAQQQPAWRITQVDGPLYSVTYSYFTDPNDPNAADDLYNLAAVHLDPTGLNRTTSFTYTHVTGQNGTENSLLASVTDPLGHVLSYSYSLPANCTNTVWVTGITEPAGVDASNYPRTQNWTLTAWIQVGGAWNNLILARCDNGLSGAEHLAFTMGSDLQLRKILYTYGSGGGAHWTTYDSANNVTVQTTPYDSNDAGAYYDLARYDNYTYGPHGNQLTHTVNGFSGTETTTWYNASQYFQKASVTDFDGKTTSFGVGDNTGADPSDNTRPVASGNKGEVLWVRDAGYSVSTNPSYHRQFTYYYNQYGQKTSEVNLNNVETDYTYGDQWGNLTQIVQDPGTSPHLNRTTSMSYRADGKATASTDPNGRQSTFSFNNLGQPLTASFPATTGVPAETVTYTYGGNGRLATVTDNRGTTSLSYENGCDRVSSMTDPVTGAISYTYGIPGERLTMTLPAGSGGGTWTYAYTNQMLPKDDPSSYAPRLSSITDDQGRRVDYTLDYFGPLKSVKWNQTFDQSGNLTSYCQTDYTYEPSSTDNTRTWGRLQEVKNTWNWKINYPFPHWSQSTLLQNDYIYDNAGLRLNNQLTNASGPLRTEVYSYDEQNRLKTVDYGDGQTQSYSFDAMGNRSQRVDSAAGTDNYTYNAANMLLTRGANSYTNDSNGNTLTGGGRTNTWDSQNRLVQCVNGATTSTFTYAADGLKHRSVSGSTTTDYVLDASMFVRELRGGTSYATYLVGSRGPEYRRDDSAGTIRWYVYDGLGSVLGEVDPNGNLTASRSYDVYGAVRTSAGTSTSKHKFVGSLGHPSDDETGLIYMQARYMDPVTGRFVSQDPSKNGANWFAYASDDPVNRVDPSGNSDISELELMLGNALVFIGFWLLDDLPGEFKNPKIFAHLLDKISEKFEMEGLNGLAKMLGLLCDAVEAYHTMKECGGLSSSVAKMAGYELMLEGQMLLTLADVENPGGGDWWGYETAAAL